MSNRDSSKQILLSVIGVAILVVAVVGVSFAFFNYTRTGQANTVRTGTITFSTSNETILIENAFPIAKASVATATTNVGVGTVRITGNTSYTNGIDFTVTAEEVSNNIGNTTGKLPISIQVSSTNLSNVKAKGSNSGTMTLNSYEDGATLTSGSVIASGRIPANTSVNGIITIKAYVDLAAVAITDTYNGTTNATDNMGTESTWVNGRTVLTTEEWNALSSTPATFKIRVVAEDGI